jgi:single-strand DNA-binding protein
VPIEAAASAADAPSVNLAVVRGVCSSPAEVRVLPSGATLVVLQVTTRTGPEPAVSVPVVAWDPAASVADLDVGDEIVAVGRVRRRFYRAAGVTASRVEIEATNILPAKNRRRVEAVLRRAVDALDDLLQ